MKLWLDVSASRFPCNVLLYVKIFFAVFALLGVLFIARPESIFGHSPVLDPVVEKGTLAQRLVAVGYVSHPSDRTLIFFLMSILAMF